MSTTGRALMQRIEALENRCDFLQRRNDGLRAALQLAGIRLEEAAREIEDWGSYAFVYFHMKHDLGGTIERFRRYADLTWQLADREP